MQENSKGGNFMENDVKNINYYKYIIDHIQDKIFIIDKNYKVTYMNKVARDSLTIDEDNDKVHYCYKVSHDYDTPCSNHGVYCPLEKVIETGSPISIVHDHSIEPEIQCWEDILATPIKDEDGNVTHILEAIHDTTLLHQSKKDIKNILHETIFSLAKTVEKRDPYTSGHQSSVAKLSVAIAKELGLNKDEQKYIEIASALHDIGKIHIPSEILTTPVKLDDVKFALLKQHSEVGYDILKNINFKAPVAKMILQHHENLDGTGYPAGLKGDDILLGAKIIRVADTVESMLFHRPYRPALGLEFTLNEIKNNRGIIYEASIVDICLKLFEEGFTFDTPKLPKDK